MTELPRPRYNAWRTRPGKSSPTLIAERLAAIQRYTVLDGIAMAIRADRGRRGLDQRAYAELVGLSKSQLARLESDPGSIRLTQVLSVLAATDHRLGIHACERPGEESEDEPDDEDVGPAEDAGRDAVPEGSAPLTADDWPVVELMARTSAGARFPAHKEVRRVGYGGPAWFERSYQCWASPPKGPDWTAEIHPVRSGR